MRLELEAAWLFVRGGCASAVYGRRGRVLRMLGAGKGRRARATAASTLPPLPQPNPNTNTNTSSPTLRKFTAPKSRSG